MASVTATPPTDRLSGRHFRRQLPEQVREALLGDLAHLAADRVDGVKRFEVLAQHGRRWALPVGFVAHCCSVSSSRRLASCALCLTWIGLD
jgi:hypothetical protein